MYSLSDIADRLKSYNCKVIEKDFSGQAAMEAARNQQPPPPEPSDADVAAAVWVRRLVATD